MMLSLHMEQIYSHLSDESAVRLDPGRIASYALAGMGFLGAGAIITGKGIVKGLTTAAGLWMITAVGLAVGAGYFIPAVLVTVFSLFALYVLRRTKSLFDRDVYRRIQLACDNKEGLFNQIEQRIEKHPRTSIQSISVERDLDKNFVHFDISIIWKKDFEWRELLRDLTEISAVRNIIMSEAKVP
jgi:putative Mg2+ transporter-C (MgtC) family protein